MSSAQRGFSVLALVVVFSLVATAVGTAVVDGLTSGGSNEIKVDTSRDETADGLRTQAAGQPTDVLAAAQLANHLAQTGKLNEAIIWYEKALVLKPDGWDIRFDFARSLADGGKRGDAELQFQKVIAAQPQNPQVHFYLAELYKTWAPARTAAAVAEYQKVIAVGPDTYVAQRSAQALAELGYATPAVNATPATPSGA